MASGVGGCWWNVTATMLLVGPEVPVLEGAWEQPDAASVALLARVVGESSTGLAMGVPLVDADARTPWCDAPARQSRSC